MRADGASLKRDGPCLRRSDTVQPAATGGFGRRLLLGAALLVVLGPGARGEVVHPTSPPADTVYVPAVLPVSQSALVRSDNRFALDLYGQIGRGDGNIVFSPYSISLALAIIQGGARGSTAAQIARVLHLPNSPREVAEAYSRYTALALPLQGDGGILSVANSLWVRQDFPLRPAFAKNARRYYGATVRSADFGRAAEAARSEINDWVATATRGRIANLIGPGGVGAATRLVVANAVYFRGKWKFPFQPSDTAIIPFYLNGGEPTDVPMMHRTAELRMIRLGDSDLLELPYEAGLSMVVLLPTAPDGLPDLERHLTAEKLAAWLAELDHTNPTKVDVWLPKFRSTFAVDLQAPLERLGMAAAFQQSAADFSGMSTAQGLYVSDVIHKACIDVDEEGTEAAAATMMAVEIAAINRPNPTQTFLADHPFLYLIRENFAGGLLFLGRTVDPR